MVSRSLLRLHASMWRADVRCCIQVGILRLLRLLGQGNKALSDAMSDILAQVCACVP